VHSEVIAEPNIVCSPLKTFGKKSRSIILHHTKKLPELWNWADEIAHEVLESSQVDEPEEDKAMGELPGNGNITALFRFPVRSFYCHPIPSPKKVVLDGIGSAVLCQDRPISNGVTYGNAVEPSVGVPPRNTPGIGSFSRLLKRALHLIVVPVALLMARKNRRMSQHQRLEFFTILDPCGRWEFYAAGCPFGIVEVDGLEEVHCLPSATVIRGHLGQFLPYRKRLGEAPSLRHTKQLLRYIK
jgi:hypothetical protein